MLPKMLFFMALVTFLGCEHDLEYDLPGSTPRLVVNALLCQDSLLQIEVSVSAGPGDGAKIKSLKDAKILLYEDGVRVSDFVIDSLFASPLNLTGDPIASVAPTKLYFHRTISTTARSGRPYSIEVSYPDLPKVNASAMVPRPVRARTIAQPLNESIYVNGTPLDRLVFEIDDNGNPSNYYGLEILATKTGSTESPVKIQFFSGEKAFAENLVVSSNAGQHNLGVYYNPENGVYFSNRKFLGNRKQFDVYVNPMYLTSQYSLRVRVLTLSTAYFEFATSYQRQKLNGNNPFAEPTQVYNNINGGLGIFAAYSVSEVGF
jgi:hypothetical protein